jgi:1-acyl-sn-glycerol-3-phosphate acyltransferase
VTASPLLGACVPRRGSAAARAFGRLVLGLVNFRIEGEVPDLPKFVVAVAPHTSNWDFVVGMATMFALDLRLSFIGKHTLFRWPFAGVLRWLGGIPVDRGASHGLVGEAVKAFASTDRRILAIAPEGTRKSGARFRSGFLHIARGANVPVVLASLDYGSRCVRFGPSFMPGEDVDAELARVEAFFARVVGRRKRA